VYTFNLCTYCFYNCYYYLFITLPKSYLFLNQQIIKILNIFNTRIIIIPLDVTLSMYTNQEVTIISTKPLVKKKSVSEAPKPIAERVCDRL